MTTARSRRWSRRTCASSSRSPRRYRNQGVPFLDLIQEGRSACARGREVRPPQGLQVLDLRDLVDPPGRRPCARRQGADDPDADAHRREAEQDRPLGAQAARRAGPRAETRPRSRATSSFRSTRWSRSAAARRRRSRSRSRSATRRTRSSGTSSPTRASRARGGRRGRAAQGALPRSCEPRTASDACSSSATGSTASTRDAGRDRRDLQRHARAHPADREVKV